MLIVLSKACKVFYLFFTMFLLVPRGKAGGSCCIPYLTSFLIDLENESDLKRSISMQNFEPLPRFKVTSPLTIFKKVTCILKGKESFNGFTTYDDSVFKTYSIQNQGEI